MSKTNSTQTPASQSVSASNDAPSSASTKPAFNYAAAAARSSNSSRPGSNNATAATTSPAPPAPSFASAVGTSSSTLASNSSSAKPSNRVPDAISTNRTVNGASAVKSPVLNPERKSSIASVKSHNIKPSSSHISFGSLTEIPAKADDASVLSSSPANPPTLARRDGPPVFGSVVADPAKKTNNSSSSTTSTAQKPSTASSAVGPGPSKVEKKKIDFQSFFMSGGETASNPPPPPASSGSAPSPSISYRGDPSQSRRNTNNPDSQSASVAPVSPRPAHVAIANGPSTGGSFHSPLSVTSRAFTPAQGQPPISQPPPHHQYGMSSGHWPGGPAPNSPHFVPGNPPMSANMPNYPLPNNALAPHHVNSSQYLPKPPQPFPHRNGPGGQSVGSSSPMYPPSTGRSNLHHPSRSGVNAPPSPRLPSSSAPNGTQSPNYQHPSNSQGMPAPYWPQGPYPPTGPGPYPPYGYNPNAMPTYPHPNNFPPPQHGQHHSPQPTSQTGPSIAPPTAPPQSSTSSTVLSSSSRTHPAPVPPLPVPSSPVSSNSTYAPPYPTALYSPGGGHSRGPSLSYNAPTFNPSSSDFKPHTPNAAAPAFQPRRSAAVAIKKPLVAPISETPEKQEEPLPATQTSTDRSASTSAGGTSQVKSSNDSMQQKVKTEEKKVQPGSLKTAEKVEVTKEDQNAIRKAEEEKKAAERKAAQEAEAKAQAEEAMRLEQEKKEKAQKEAKDQAEKEAKAKAEQEAKEKAEQEAIIKAQKEAEEKEQRELKAQREKELTAKVAEERLAKAAQSQPEAKTVSSTSQPKATSGSTIAAPVAKSLSTSAEPISNKTLPTSQPEPASGPALPPKPLNGNSSASGNAKARPTPIDVNASALQNNTGESMTPSSALSSARNIEDLGQVSYPENISSPRSELNADAVPGKFRYDREFLLQFMEFCKGKPVQLPDLDSIGMVDGNHAAMNPISRTQSTGGQRRTTGPLPASNRGPPGALPPSGGSISMMGPAGLANRGGTAGGMSMFNPAAGRTSEERFNQSNRPSMGAMPIGMGIMLPGRPNGQMSRSPSTNALPGMLPNGARDPSRRSGRGSRRDAAPNPPPPNVNPNLNRGMTMQPMFPFEVVPPLQPSANSWAAARSTQLEEDSPEQVNRKVKALLNKLTLDKFESISDQVITWANKSEKEHDGRILRQVIALIFEKATDEAHWSEMYAKLCRKLMEKLSPEVKDENVLDASGNKVHGGQLFRKYLLNRCQEDYERGWSKRDELAAAAAGKAADDAVKKAANEKSLAEAQAEGKETPKEAEILSDEYYAAQKAKRQGLGLVRFIGELFKLNMLTERIMHECIKKLLSNIDTPEEEDIESLCRLMMTVGGLLDHEKAISHMNVYFTRMATMVASSHLTARARFMIQDVIDTRNNNWVGRNVASGPKLISQIHEEAAQAAAEQSRQAQQASKNRMNDMNRNSRGGRNRDQAGGLAADGWSAVGGIPASVPRPSKAGDLTQFGKVRDISSSGRSTFGPSNVFANKGKLKDSKPPLEREPAVAVAPNPFAALGGDAPEASAAGLSRKPSSTEIAPAGRPRLNLAPRTLPLPGQNASTDSDATDKNKSAGEALSEEKKQEVEEQVRRTIKGTTDEFFHVRSVDEGIQAILSLDQSRYHEQIRSLVERAIDKKQAEVDLTASLLQKLSKQNVPQSAFVKAWEPIIEQLDDTAVDAVYAYEFSAKLMKASGLSESDVQQLSQKIDTDDIETASKRLMDCFHSAKLE